MRIVSLGTLLLLMLSSESCRSESASDFATQNQEVMRSENDQKGEATQRINKNQNTSYKTFKHSSRSEIPKISQSRFKGDKITIKLPGTYSDVVVAGGGRFLIFHLDQLRLLAIFDATTARVVEYLPLDSDDISFTAGLDKLVVVLRDQQKIQRYNLQTFKKEVTRPLLNGTVTQISMGSASHGPVLVSRGSMSIKEQTILDLQTLEPTTLEQVGSDWRFKDIKAHDCIMHASADGTVFGIARKGVASHGGYGNLLIKRNQIQGLYQNRSLKGSLPDSDGRLIYSFLGVFTNTLREISKEDYSRALPAVHGNLNIRVRADSPNVTVHLKNDTRSLLTIPKVVPKIPERDWHKDFFVSESGRIVRLHYIPDADVLAFLPPANNQVVLHRVHLKRALQNSPLDYLFVNSHPNFKAQRGSRYEYELKASAKQKPLKQTVISGPDGISITPTGIVQWDVPAQFDKNEVSVILSITDAVGQELFQTYQIKVNRNDKKKSIIPSPQVPASLAQKKPKSQKKIKHRPQAPRKKIASRLRKVPAARPASSIKPEKNQKTISLPGTIDDLTVGGGGQYLVLHLSSIRQLAIFDTTKAAVVKYIPVNSNDILFTAGAKDLIILLRDKQIFQRWNLTTLKRELTATSPISAPIASMVMGYAATGPLVLFYGDDLRKMGARFLDPQTLREIKFNSQYPIRVSVEPHHVKSNADGQIISYGGGTLEILEDSVKSRPTQIQNPFVLLPSADGAIIYTPHGFMSRQMTPIHRNKMHGIPIPSIQPGFYLLGRDNPQDRKKKELFLFQDGAENPLAKLTNVNPALSFSERQRAPGPHVMALSKHFHYLPYENLLIQIPATNQSLILHTIDLDTILNHSARDYLFTVSQPPRTAVRCQLWKYQIEVKSKQGRVQYELAAGPKGMTVSPLGLVSWQVPASFSETKAFVLLAITDASGQQIFHKTNLSLTGELEMPMLSERKSKLNKPVSSGTVSLPLHAKKPKLPIVENMSPLIAVKPFPLIAQKPESYSGQLPQKMKTIESVKLPPINPVQFEGQKKEVKLPSTLSDFVIGGGGHYLIMHISAINQLAIFDISEAAVVKYLPISPGRILIAAGAQDLIVAYPDKNLFQRWNLTTFELEQTTTCPTPHPLVAMTMGNASAGPLVLFTGTGPRNFKPQILDPKNLQFLHLEHRNPISLFIEPHFIQASADGKIVAYGNEGMLALTKTSILHIKTQVGNPQLLLPNADGSIIYSPYYILDNYLNVIETLQGADMRIPSIHPGYFLFVPRNDRNPINRGITFFAEGNRKPLITLNNIDVTLCQSIRNRRPQTPTFFKRFIYLPAANALIQIPTKNNTLIIHKINLNTLLQESGIDYLFATSRPDPKIHVGQNWQYQIDAKSKQGGVTYELIKAPDGMTISETGLLSWRVPENIINSKVQVSVRLEDRLQQEFFYSFRLTPF